MIMWFSFFDDYIVLSQPELARSSELTASSLFKLLGWIFAEEGRKCLPFGQECEALGVVFNWSKSGEGVYTLNPGCKKSLQRFIGSWSKGRLARSKHKS